MNSMEKKANHFSGQLGFVLAAAGSAVGVGNLWRFPYLAAKDGGGLFLLVYLVLVLIMTYYAVIGGWSKTPDYVIGEMERNGEHFRRKSVYRVMIRYIAPVMMLILFLQSTGILS